MGDDEMVSVAYSGKVTAQCEGRIIASEERPYPVAVLPNGKVRAATHGDFVIGMALSNSRDGVVLIEVQIGPLSL